MTSRFIRYVRGAQQLAKMVLDLAYEITAKAVDLAADVASATADVDTVIRSALRYEYGALIGMKLSLGNLVAKLEVELDRINSDAQEAFRLACVSDATGNMIGTERYLRRWEGLDGAARTLRQTITEAYRALLVDPVAL